MESARINPKIPQGEYLLRPTFGLHKGRISSVKAIQNSHHTETICELQVMKIVGFGGWKERKMVPPV